MYRDIEERVKDVIEMNEEESREWNRLLEEEDEIVERMRDYICGGERILVEDKLKLVLIEIRLEYLRGRIKV